MAIVTIDDTHLTNIANAIRSKNSSTDTYKPSEMASAIKSIETGGGVVEPDYKTLYQRVESITSDGASYCFTDIIADNTCGMELIASFPKLEDKPPMGSRTDNSSTRFYMIYPISSSGCYFGFNTGNSISCKPSINTTYRLQTNFLNSRLANIFNMNGIRVGSASISSTLTQHTVPIAIFGYNHATNGISLTRAFTFYNARISKDNEVIREYIPCYRKSDGEIGLYEKFTGQFLTNAGTSTFEKGANVEW